MIKTIRYILFLAFLSVFYLKANAQDISAVNIQKIPDQQINQIIDEMNNRGLSLEEAIVLAQSKGLTSNQIDDLKKRILSAQSPKNNTYNIQNSQKETSENFQPSEVSEKTKVTATELTKRIFGFQLFNSEKLSFEPSVNIPAPQTYVLGLGDELLITVWGASQQTYLLKIGSNGAVTIPEVGPVYLLGIEFSKAKELIRNRLMSIYHGMEGDSPNTFIDLSLSNMRPIKVNIVGDVVAPGTYTLPATASAFNALYLSGGPNENGSFRNIEIIRDNKVFRRIDAYDYLVNGNTELNIQLREQDVIFIPTYQKRVEVTGSFKRNGLFELTNDERLTDLIKYAGGFTDQAFKSHLSLIRITDTEKKVVDIDQSVFESFVPNNGDSYTASDVVDVYQNRISITGAIYRPGIYELTDGLTLSGLLQKAGGVKDSYYSTRGIIIRQQSDSSPETVSFDVNKVLDKKADLRLEKEDQVIIQDIFTMRQKRVVRILGEVRFPGEYDYADDMTLKDLIFKSGGFTEAASESYIELARRRNYEESNKLSEEIVKLFHFDVDRTLALDQEADTFNLKPFDYVYVRKAPSYHEQRTVYITGEVRYPGAYSIGSKKERVSDLIQRAGGLTPEAFIKGARMKRYNPMAKFNMNTLRNNSADSLLTRAEEQIANDQLELRLESIMKHPGSDYDYFLKEGDAIVVPEISQAIRIAGEIQNPIGMSYENGKSLKYYVNRSGGYSDNAKKGKTFVIYSDGTTKISRNFIWHRYPPIEPGCQIIVPAKPERKKTDNTGKWLAVASTLTTILIAVSRF